MINVSAQVYSAPFAGILQRDNRHHLTIFLGLIVASVIIYLQFSPWQQPTGGDLTMWDYMAQSIVRGAIPYKDVVNIKTPLGAYLSAIAILVGRSIDVRDLIAIRYLYIILSALTVAMTYLVAQAYWQRKDVSLLAAVMMLSYDSFAIWNASGSQVKTPAILCGLLSLYSVARGRAFIAGCWGALAFWCWQPGLLFVGVAGLVFCRFLTKPFHPQAWRTALGAFLPLLLGGLCFFAQHAWTDFYRWNFQFNTTSNSSVRSLGKLEKSAERVVPVIQKAYNNEWLWFALAPLGFLWHGVEIIRRVRRYQLADLLSASWRLAPIIALIVYIIFSALNLQSGPDMIFFLPFISIYAAYILSNIVEYLPRRRELMAAIIILVTIFKVADAFAYKPEFTLQDEELQWREVVAQLAPSDTVYAQGSLDLLVLYNLPNANKYIYLDRGKDIYAGQLEPGGFDGIIMGLKQKHPKFVSLAKLNHVYEQKRLLAWMDELYEPYAIITSTNNGVSSSTFPCNVYRIKGANSFTVENKEGTQH
ncbi:MAG: DolP-mannose mannosyltransferase [Acidobacteriota bacterium]